MNNNPYPTQQPPSGPYPSNPAYPPQGQPGPYTQYPPQGQPGYPPPGYPQGQPSMTPQQPPVQQQPPKKKPGIFKIGCGALAAVVVLIVIISVATNGGGKSSSSSDTTSSNSSNSSSGASTTNNSTQSQPTTWQTTHTYTGNGIQKTETFSVGNDWKIQWSCTPSSFMGNQYNVIVAVYNSDATVADPAAINAMCKDGNTSGETEEHTGGNVYLDINSEGDWSITVQEPK